MTPAPKWYKAELEFGFGGFLEGSIRDLPGFAKAFRRVLQGFRKWSLGFGILGFGAARTHVEALVQCVYSRIMLGGEPAGKNSAFSAVPCSPAEAALA